MNTEISGSYVGKPTIPEGMTVSEYRRSRRQKMTVTMFVTDTSLVKRLLDRRSIEVVSIEK